VNQKLHEERKRRASAKPDFEGDEEVGAGVPRPPGYREDLRGIVGSLLPEGFERLSQRLLREAGFVEVIVTGRSGDGGIDGYGTLQVNPFVSFKVHFQCKRYVGVVGAGQVRDFRGALQGRADKGILLTTGTFSADARREANRDGVPPIELVDGEKLMDMFVNLELGIKPIQSYEVDRAFFAEFDPRLEK
jgi:restriction system protein